MKNFIAKAPEVLAILNGSFTEFRRPAKLPPVEMIQGRFFLEGNLITWFEKANPGIRRTLLCPYATRLRVKEAWGYGGCSIKGSGPTGQYKATVYYLADGTQREILFRSDKALYKAIPKQHLVFPAGFDELEDDARRQIHNTLLNDWWKQIKTQPVGKMPARFSRFTLEVTNICIDEGDWVVSVTRC